MTLTKLKPTLLAAELTGVSDSLESKTVKVWIDTLATHLTNWIVWFSKETMKATMLSCLERYPNTALILECAERIMQKASNVKSEGECCTNYKSHNTAYRVYIAASGLIVHISRAYGGHASDKFIVQDSGVLTRLVPGNGVVSDRGSAILVLLLPLREELNSPAFSSVSPSKSCCSHSVLN